MSDQEKGFQFTGEDLEYVAEVVKRLDAATNEGEVYVAPCIPVVTADEEVVGFIDDFYGSYTFVAATTTRGKEAARRYIKYARIVQQEMNLPDEEEDFYE